MCVPHRLLWIILLSKFQNNTIPITKIRKISGYLRFDILAYEKIRSSDARSSRRTVSGMRDVMRPDLSSVFWVCRHVESGKLLSTSFPSEICQARGKGRKFLQKLRQVTYWRQSEETEQFTRR